MTIIPSERKPPPDIDPVVVLNVVLLKYLHKKMLVLVEEYIFFRLICYRFKGTFHFEFSL